MAGKGAADAEETVGVAGQAEGWSGWHAGASMQAELALCRARGGQSLAVG